MKKFSFPVTLLALAVMVGCAEDESQIVGGVTSNADNSDLVSINVYAGTTKGTDTTTSTLEDSENVILHINDSGSISETFSFVYADDDWSQDGYSLFWYDITFPANFYSLHDSTPLTGLKFDDDDAIYSGYSVAKESTDHNDLVYHASKLDAIPSGSVVSAHHKHALSKIHFYVSTGTANVYIARVQMVNVDDTGTITITPLAADASSDATDIAWSDNDKFEDTFLYYYVGDTSDATTALKTDTNGDDPIINSDDDAPMMIIPQSTTGSTFSEEDFKEDDSTISGTYIEVIYYATNADGLPLIGYSSVAEMTNASDYKDQSIVLYVKAGFSLSYEFEANKEYNITLGIGSTGSTGGVLLADYYVDKTGEEIILTNISDGGEEEETTDVPDLEEGDDIFSDNTDKIDILISAYLWSDDDNAFSL